MGKAAYIGIAGVARKVKQPYFGVGGVARKAKAGYVGVNGVARQWLSSKITFYIDSSLCQASDGDTWHIATGGIDAVEDSYTFVAESRSGYLYMYCYDDSGSPAREGDLRDDGGVLVRETDTIVNGAYYYIY